MDRINETFLVKKIVFAEQKGSTETLTEEIKQVASENSEFEYRQKEKL